MLSDDEIRRMILALVLKRAGKSICPSDAARALSSDQPTWRSLMPRIRNIAWALAGEGLIEVTQAGKPLRSGPEHWRGPVRLRWIRSHDQSD